MHSFLNKKNEIQKDVSVETIIRQKILDLTPAIKKQDAQIILFNLPKKLCCSPNQIGIIFYNLINNALKFNESSPPIIRISAEMTDKVCLFKIEDNGIGMEERHLGRIFDVFQRLHRKSQFAGTGVGLSICKKVVERHGGKIWVTSQKGTGSTFYFTLLKTLEEDNNNDQ